MSATSVTLYNHGPLTQPGSFGVEHYGGNVHVKVQHEDGSLDLALEPDEARAIVAALAFHEAELAAAR